MRAFSDFGLRWSRRSTLAFVAFAVIVVAFTALALSWNGLSAFKSSASADPALGALMIAIPGPCDADTDTFAAGDAAPKGRDDVSHARQDSVVVANAESEGESVGQGESDAHGQAECDAHT